MKGEAASKAPSPPDGRAPLDGPARGLAPLDEPFLGQALLDAKRLGEIVLLAAALEGAEREAYLAKVYADDPALAEAARARLAAAESVTTFLERPAAARLGGERADASATDQPASALSPDERYELGESLGRGGMGRVVEAYDRQLERKVALKFLTSDDPALRELFLREGRAQARVDHEHVLDVYDGGELEGRPFLSVRHVAGGTLEEVAPGLSLEQRIRLLIQAAEGLHAAHRRGLLHRDVKPANVLVEEGADGDLRALVSDFGIAIDADGTAVDAFVGSPQYVAPERLTDTATVDRRSDVYSLGITMYKVLTGALPYEGPLTLDVLRQTVAAELPPPREKNPDLPAEVEAIVVRATAKDPQERYASARAVAEDLRRFLDGEVAEAYAATVAYRLTRFALRHRPLVATAAFALLALVAASIAVLVFALRADSARERAELRRGQAEELIRFMVVDLREKLEATSRLAVLDDVAEAATDYFAAVPEAELSEEELLRRSRMLYQLGNLRIQQGDLAAAAAPMAESLELVRRLHQLAPEDPERLFGLGQSLFWVGYVAWERGDLAAARGSMEEYLEISRRLVEIDPENHDWQLELAYARSNLGSLLQAENDLESALAEFRASLEIKEELVAADPENRGWRTELAAGHNTVAVVFQDLGGLAEAREHFEAERAILSSLVKEDSTDLRTQDFLSSSHVFLSRVYLAMGEPDLAEQELYRAREILTALVNHDPDNRHRQSKLAMNHLDLGQDAFRHNDLERARQEWQQARHILETLLAIDSTSYEWRKAKGLLQLYLAQFEASRGEREQARSAALQAIEDLTSLVAERPTDTGSHLVVARGYLLLGSLEPSPAAAGAAFNRAAEHLEPFVHQNHDFRMLATWGAALRCLGRLEEARSVDENLRSMGYVQVLDRESCPEIPFTAS